MSTLIAYAEKAKETIIKESKYQMKKVFGVINTTRKKKSTKFKSNKGQGEFKDNHNYDSLAFATRGYRSASPEPK
jgi:hypothetical protein